MSPTEREASILSGKVNGAASESAALRMRIEQAGRILAGDTFPCPHCEVNIRRIVELERLLAEQIAVRQAEEKRR